MKRILCLMPLLLSLIYAQNNVGDINPSHNIITTPTGGDPTITENSGVYNMRAPDETYRREVIYNFVLLNDSKRIPGMIPNQANFVNVVNASQATSNVSNATDDNRTVVVAGFCLIKENIFIELQPGSLMVDCETNIGIVTMFAKLRSVEGLKSLMVDPVWIDYRNGRYKVANSEVTNEAQTSYNIATYVNDRKLAKIGWSALEVTSDEAQIASNSYLKAIEESRKKQELGYVDVVSGGNSSYGQPVQITNVERPQASDYMIGAGINIIASTIKSTAELFKKDLPYLYEVVGGTKIYVDMQVYAKGEKIR